MRQIVLLSTVLLALPVQAAPAGAPNAPEPSLLSFSAGALVVQAPQEYGSGWSALWMFDEKPGSGWATPEGVVTPQTVVLALPERTTLKRLEFDTGSTDGENRGVKDVTVEVSDTSAKDGFKTIAAVTLKDKMDNQRFPVSAEVPGRWVRLTLRNNHGDPQYLELMDVRGYGVQLTKTAFPDVSGTYETDYGDFHLRQQGNAISGCYEHEGGLIVNGGIEGRVMSFTWREEGPQQGPAVMVFASDGRQFFGLWWNEGATGSAGGVWNGTRKSTAVGTCPHWKGASRSRSRPTSRTSAAPASTASTSTPTRT